MAAAADLSLNDLEGKKPELVLISPNDPRAMVRYVDECKALGIPYIYDPSQQIPRLSGDELQDGLDGALALFVNKYEFGMVQKKTGLSGEEIRERTQFTVVTLGEEGSLIYQGDKQMQIPVVKPDKIADPTGVGDAFRGGFLRIRTRLGFGNLCRDGCCGSCILPGAGRTAGAFLHPIRVCRTLS